MPIKQAPSPATATPTPAIPVAANPSPSAIYEGLNNQKDVLQGQMRDLVGQRNILVDQLTEANAANLTGPSKTGLEQRIAAVDKRIADVDQQIAAVDAQVSKQAAIPGAIVPHVGENRPSDEIPDAAFVLMGIFMFVVLLPLSIAYARRIWKRTATVVSSIPADLMARVQRIEQAVETSGLEIERIGEGQRFITKLLSEKVPALPRGIGEKRDV